MTDCRTVRDCWTASSCVLLDSQPPRLSPGLCLGVDPGDSVYFSKGTGGREGEGKAKRDRGRTRGNVYALCTSRGAQRAGEIGFRLPGNAISL